MPTVHDKAYASRYEEGVELVWGGDPEKVVVDFVDFLGAEGVTSGVGLDIGCAEGRHTVFMARRGYRVCGIELSISALRRAKDWARREGLTDRVSPLLSDVTQLPHPPNVFDFAIDFGLLHFLDEAERRRYLQNLVRVMKPGGYYLLSIFSSTNMEDPQTVRQHLNHPAHCFARGELCETLSPEFLPIQFREWKKVEEEHFHWMLTTIAQLAGSA